MYKAALVALALLILGATCDEQPCDRYVDYMCDCHDDDPGFDCQELRAIYADASPDVQAQCDIALATQQADDADAGLLCDDTGDSGR